MKTIVYEIALSALLSLQYFSFSQVLIVYDKSLHLGAFVVCGLGMVGLTVLGMYEDYTAHRITRDFRLILMILSVTLTGFACLIISFWFGILGLIQLLALIQFVRRTRE